jgi:NADH:ubiquinone oxidoreductase subunit 3 (subunit A)
MIIATAAAAAVVATAAVAAAVAAVAVATEPSEVRRFEAAENASGRARPQLTPQVNIWSTSLTMNRPRRQKR